MFSFVVKRLGFLKAVPLLPAFYDSLLKIWVLFTNHRLLNWIDEIEAEVLKWPDTAISVHHYGGAQFNHREKEFAHLHSNGLLDILFDRQMKAILLREHKIVDHHVFKNSGWISFYLRKETDVNDALILLRKAYQLSCN